MPFHRETLDTPLHLSVCLVCFTALHVSQALVHTGKNVFFFLRGRDLETAAVNGKKQ